MNIFEEIRRKSDDGYEYWSARELSKALQYKDYRNFRVAIYKAMETCKGSGQIISDHFGETTEMEKQQKELSNENKDKKSK